MNDRIRDSIQFWNFQKPDVLAQARERKRRGEPCQLCPGTGLIRLTKAGVDQGIFSCACYIAQREIDQEPDYRKYSLLGEPERGLTFGSLKPWGEKAQWKTAEHAITAMKSLVASPHNHKWVTICGHPGCGKSTLVAAAYNQISHMALYIQTAKLASLMFDGLKKPGEVDEDNDRWLEINDLRNLLIEVPVLMLDDLGIESNTPFINSTLTDIIAQRYQLRTARPTIITTNLSSKLLIERYQRLASRILDVDLSYRLLIDLPDYRMRTTKEKHGES